MRQWQQQPNDSDMSFVKGSDMTGTVATQLLEAELATAAGLHHAAVMWDMSDFYETLNRDKLRQSHQATGFPTVLSAITNDMYGCERTVRHGDIVSRIGCPSRGIPAGCAAATYHVQAYLTEQLQQWKSRHPQLGVNVHIDDITIYGSSTSAVGLAAAMAEGLHDMQDVVER